MKKIGCVVQKNHDLTAQSWCSLIDELPQLERPTNEPDAPEILHAFLIRRDERVGAFQWTESPAAIVVSGELSQVREFAEMIANRLGGQFQIDPVEV